MKELIELADRWRIASFQPRDESGTDADEYKKHQMKLCADELLAVLDAMKPRPIEGAPKGVCIDVYSQWPGETRLIRWPNCRIKPDGSISSHYGPMGVPPSKQVIVGWLPLLSDGGEE